MRAIVCIAASLLFTVALAAQEQLRLPMELLDRPTVSPIGPPPLTLEEIEAVALINDADLKVANALVAVARERARLAPTLDDPSFGYQGWGIPMRKPWDLNQAQHMFMVTQPLPGSGKRALRYEAAESDVDAAEADVESVRQEIRAQVHESFYSLLRNYDEVRVQREQTALAQQSIEAARLKYVAGRAPEEDLLKAQIALTKLVARLLTFNEDGDLARARLNLLMGRDPSSPLEITGRYALPQDLPQLNQLERIAAERRPELTVAAAMVKRAEENLRLANKSMTPDAAVSAGYMLMPAGSTFRNNYLAQFSITLPWLNRTRHRDESDEAAAELATAKAEYESKRAIVFEQIEEALVHARASWRRIALYRDNLRPQAEITLKAAIAAYQSDRTDFLNLLESQDTTLDVDLAFYRALADFDAEVANLERATGATLPRNLPMSDGDGKPRPQPAQLPPPIPANSASAPAAEHFVEGSVLPAKTSPKQMQKRVQP